MYKCAYSRVRIGKYFSDTFFIKNGVKKENAVSPLLSKCTLEFAIRKVQANQEVLKLHLLMLCADDIK